MKSGIRLVSRASKYRRNPVVAEPLEGRLLLSTVELVKDFDTRTEGAGNGPTPVQSGDLLYFTAVTSPRQVPSGEYEELWRTDGTAAGTFALGDLVPGDLGSDPVRLVDAGGRLFFQPMTAEHGRELWVSDGTVAGTKLVKDIRPGSGSGVAAFDGDHAVAFNGKLLFTADDGTGASLWVSDGTDAGTTRLVAGMTLGVASTDSDVAVAGDHVLFAADTAAGRELWRTDGTAAGTRIVKDIIPGSGSSGPDRFATGPDGIVYFFAFDVATGRELWRSDGTESGTYLLKDLEPGPGAPNDSQQKLVPVADGVFFTSAQDLWKTDGTTATTRKVAALGSSFTNFAAVGNAVYYGASASDARRVYRNDGGASTIVGSAAGGALAQPDSFTGFVAVGGNRVFFRGNEGELWTIDNADTPGPTARRVKDIYPGASRSGPELFAAGPGGAAFFTAEDGVTGRELWLSDGTDAGTRLVKDVNLTPLGSTPANFIPGAGNSAYFTLKPSVERGLYRTDGTPAGTTLLRSDISIIGSGSATTTDGRTFFAGQLANTSGIQLFQTDGTAAGTNTIGSSVSTTRITAVGNRVFFTSNPTAGPQLRVTDGTSAGTITLRATAGISTSVQKFHELNGILYFPATDSDAFGEELFRSDGTVAGTYRVTDVRPGSDFTAMQTVGVRDGALLFSAYDGTSLNLYRTQGTAATTTLVKQLRVGPSLGGAPPYAVTAADGTIYFKAADSLYRTDGTAAGTAKVIDRGFFLNSTSDLGVVGNRVVFFASPSATGGVSELWTTDGTAAGTRMLAPIGHVSSTFVSADGVTYVAARGPDDLVRLWQSDATIAGTFPVEWPGERLHGNVLPRAAIAVGNTVLTAGTDPVHGNELFRVVPGPNTAPPTAPRVTRVFVGGTAWTQSFRDFLVQSNVLGDPVDGYTIDAGIQYAALGWTNLNKVAIRFDRPVNVGQGSLIVTGVNLANYGVAGFAYDPTTYTATWTLATAGIGAERLAVHLIGVTDAVTGAALDGETKPLTNTLPDAERWYPSGDGVAGGNFRFQINVLPGDVNRSSSVTGSDVTAVRNAQNAAPGAVNSQYTVLRDVNGSGSILGSDVTAVRNRQNMSMPTGTPPTPPGFLSVIRSSSPTSQGFSPVFSKRPLTATDLLDLNRKVASKLVL